VILVLNKLFLLYTIYKLFFIIYNFIYYYSVLRSSITPQIFVYFLLLIRISIWIETICLRFILYEVVTKLCPVCYYTIVHQLMSNNYKMGHFAWCVCIICMISSSSSKKYKYKTLCFLLISQQYMWQLEICIKYKQNNTLACWSVGLNHFSLPV